MYLLFTHNYYIVILFKVNYLYIIPIRITHINQIFQK